MLRAWRERDQEKRIKTAHQALEHNSRYVYEENLFSVDNVCNIFPLISLSFDFQDGIHQDSSMHVCHD